MGSPQGIWPMLYAFFDRNNQLDRGAFEAQIDWCLMRGAPGIAMLGLLTEVSMLSTDERRLLVRWAAERIDGRVPLLATIAAATATEVIDLAWAARQDGAALLVLQPPLGAKPAVDELTDFFSRVMAAIEAPIGIQNAPEFLGTGLEPDDILSLQRRHPHFSLMKAEGPVVVVRRFLEALAGQMAVFNGRGGLELVDNLIAGCAGMIPAPETLELQLRIFEQVRAGKLSDAALSYARLAPYAVFSMQSLPVAIGVGKRSFARLSGIDANPRCRVEVPQDGFLDTAAQRWLDLAQTDPFA